jgi:DNA-binding MarR family transcriptional regulator
MTGLLDGLERERLLKRHPDREDRRMLLVELTARGRKVLDGILPDYYRRIAALMGHLTEAEKHLMVELIGKVSAGIPAVSAK